MWKRTSNRRQTTREKLQHTISCDLAVEPLERRHLLAGNVTATMTPAGVLRILGDNASNELDISQDFGFVSIVGQSGTTVNGSSGPVPLGGPINRLIVNLRGGDDVLFSPNDMEQLNILGAASIIGGSGDDTIALGNAEIMGRTVINSGPGDDLVNVGSLDFGLPVTIGNTLQVSSGPGDDTVEVRNTTLDGDIRISAGPGQNRVGVVANNTVAGSVRITTGGNSDFVAVTTSQIGGNLFVNLAGDSDALITTFIEVAGNTDFRLGAGTRDTVASSGLFHGDLRIIGSAGDDQVLLGDVAVLDRFTMIMGTGNDVLGLSDGVAAIVGGTVSGGSGVDGVVASSTAATGALVVQPSVEDVDLSNPTIDSDFDAFALMAIASWVDQGGLITDFEFASP